MTRYGMSKLVAAGMIAGSLITYFVARHHVIWAEEGVVAVPRQNVPFTDSYVDIRGWDANEWSKHPELIHALVKDNRASLVVRAATEEAVQDVLQPQQQTRSSANRSSPTASNVEQNHVQHLEYQARRSVRAAFDTPRYPGGGR